MKLRRNHRVAIRDPCREARGIQEPGLIIRPAVANSMILYSDENLLNEFIVVTTVCFRCSDSSLLLAD